MGSSREQLESRRKKAKLGSGTRFKAVEQEAAMSGARDPGAVAYTAGVRAHGKAAMTRLAQAGRRKAGRGK